MAEKLTILIVDDEPDIIDIVNNILQRQSYEVVTAYNGAEAIEKAKAHRPAVIIMDRNMPEMDGDEALTRLKESADTAAIPVIMLTAQDKYEQVTYGYKLGADQYITKPFTPSQVLNGVKMVLVKRPGLPDGEVAAHAREFLKACHQLSARSQELAKLFAAAEKLSPSQWLYAGLKARLEQDQGLLGTLKSAPQWSYAFHGWGVDFYNAETSERVDLAIGPGGHADTFDEWRIQSYIESETQRSRGFTALQKIIHNHSDATEKLIRHLQFQGWIEQAKKQGGKGTEPSIDAQLEDRWMVSAKGIQELKKG